MVHCWNGSGLRQDLAGRTTQWALAETVRWHVADNPGGGWNSRRADVAQKYLSQDYAVAMQQDLQLIAKGPHEPLPTFLRCFRRLVDIAYPPLDRNAAGDEVIVKGLARALGEETRLIARITKGGFPTFQQAQERLLRVETDDLAHERLTGR